MHAQELEATICPLNGLPWFSESIGQNLGIANDARFYHRPGAGRAADEISGLEPFQGSAVDLRRPACRRLQQVAQSNILLPDSEPASGVEAHRDIRSPPHLMYDTGGRREGAGGQGGQDGLILTEDQLAALENTNASKEAHSEFDSACPTTAAPST